MNIFKFIFLNTFQQAFFYFEVLLISKYLFLTFHINGVLGFWGFGEIGRAHV